MTLRLAVVTLVLGAALADAAGQHPLAYYALVAAVPAAAVAALFALGDVLDGSATEPLDRAALALSTLALPLLLLTTAVRAPVVGAAAPPRIGITALVACLAVLLLQAALAAAAALVVQQPALEREQSGSMAAASNRRSVVVLLERQRHEGVARRLPALAGERPRRQRAFDDVR